MKPTELMFSNCTLAILEDWFELRLHPPLQILRILKALKEVCMQRTAHLVQE
jgi:hypothetical protein